MMFHCLKKVCFHLFSIFVWFLVIFHKIVVVHQQSSVVLIAKFIVEKNIWGFLTVDLIPLVAKF